MGMFIKGIGHFLGAMIRIGLAVFLAMACIHLVLGVMQVQAASQQLPFVAAQAQTSPLPEWSNECLPQKTFVAGIGLGNAEHLVNPQTLVWPYAGELVAMQAQVAGMITNEPLPEAVLLSTNADEQILVTEQVTDKIAFLLSSPLVPASVVTSTILFPTNDHLTAVPQPPAPDSGLPPKGSGLRGLVLYGQVAEPDLWRSFGRMTLASVSSQREMADSAQELLTFPPLTMETDLIVTAVSIDNDPDDRAIILEASAGGVFTSITEIGPTNGDILNITTLTITAVPTGTTQLSLTIKSPPSPAGDSATLIGFNLNYRCSPEMPPNAVDLVIDQVASSSLVSVNTAVSFTVQVTNTGSLTATNVIVSNTLDSDGGSNFTNSPWLSCPTPIDPNVCSLGNLSPGETNTFALWLTPTLTGAITNTAVATSDQPDPSMPNIAAASLVVTDYANIFYLPIIFKPGAVAVTVTHSQNPAINQIPYSYFISVTNTGGRTIPNLIIQDDFDERLQIEQISPPAGCNGAISPPYDLIVFCDDGLLAGNTLTFSVRVRPNVTMPETVEANIKLSSLDPGYYLDNNPKIDITQINLCIKNAPGLSNAYSPLLLGETYCGQVWDQKDARYYFTFTITNPGRIVATLRPSNVPWVSFKFPSAAQLVFTATNRTSPLSWCCNVRKSEVITEYTYTEAGEKLILVKSLETFDFTYTLRLDFYPSMTNTAVLPTQNAKALTNMRLLGTISPENEMQTGWQTAVFFVGFLSAAFGLVYQQRK